jgi:Na+-transporting methylmalonyl-CoA/oxaloacetate decarboxylase beta subunit
MMRNKLLSIGIAILTVITGIIVFYQLAIRYLVPMYLRFKYSVSTNDASAIGIIGGADGPTAIYLTNSNQKELFPVFLLLFIMGIMYFIINRLRRNK